MLTTYLTRTAQLLQNPKAPTSLYSSSDLTEWINIARGQLAGEGECIRIAGTLALTQGTQVYSFTSINLPNAVTLGIQGTINVRMASVAIASGQTLMTPRGWEWFNTYHLNNPVPQQGTPDVWSQYGQGVTGTVYIDPVPDGAYTLNLDCVCYPIALVDDTTPEAIPYLWTDAVPFFAAYFALLSAQAGARQAEADRMFARYQEFTNRARRFATPSVLPFIYPQSGNPVQANQLGLQPAGGGGGQ